MAWRPMRCGMSTAPAPWPWAITWRPARLASPQSLAGPAAGPRECGDPWPLVISNRTRSVVMGSRLRGNDAELRATASSLRPAEPLHDGAAHHPVLVVLRQEIELLGEMRDALAVGGLGERVGHVGAPVAALRPERLEALLYERRHVAERVGLQRVGRRRRQLHRHVGIFRQRHRV